MARRVLFLISMTASAAMAADAVSFTREIAPILASRCLACHQDRNRGGGLSLAGYADVLKGGSSGAAVRAGLPSESLLVRYVEGNPPRMPKAGPPLSAEQAGLIRRWIEQGAQTDGPALGETWWSLRPLTRTAVPEDASRWARSPIDAFIAARLRVKGLTPSAEADRRTLIRRVTFDLHGLPPTPEEADAFAADAAPDAYEKLVDRLLSSPRYGERWARHWLDVVHYGDTHGYDKDKPRPNAWPYRDYVIRAFNGDKPYARFVREQLAGDALYPGDPEGRIATGFIAAGPWDFVGHVELREGTTDKNITRLLDRDDMVAATMSTFVSMTAHCARCHDHKFDPIPQADYYALQAVFAGVDRADQPFDRDGETYRRRLELIAKKHAVQIDLQPLLDRQEQATSSRIVELDNDTQDARAANASLGAARNDAEKAQKQQLQERVDRNLKLRKELVDAVVGAEVTERIAQLTARQKELDGLLAELPKPELVYSAASYFERTFFFRPALTPRPVHVLARGNVGSPGKEAAPGALSGVGGSASRFDAGEEGARRAALAEWIVNRDNPLTWRSIVNRVWHYHFGAGIVDSPNDFGRMGSQPTHPELLDWLAVWFRDDAQGSLKKLHRLIVTSAVYRQASREREDGARVDAENRLLWRMNRTRLDAESVRDAVLAVSGKLDTTMYGPAVRMFFFKDDHSPVYDYARFEPDSAGANRRSVYRFIVRSAPDPFMDRLDCPDASLLTPKRSTTLTAIQALALLNNPFMVKMAENFAGRLRAERPEFSGQVELAFRLAFGRATKPDELREFAAYASRHGLENLCRLIFNTNEFLFAD